MQIEDKIKNAVKATDSGPDNLSLNLSLVADKYDPGACQIMGPCMPYDSALWVARQAMASRACTP